MKSNTSVQSTALWRSGSNLSGVRATLKGIRGNFESLSLPSDFKYFPCRLKLDELSKGLYEDNGSFSKLREAHPSC